VFIGLHSGQNNYWGSILIYNENGDEIYQNTLETFEDLIECDVAIPIETSPAHFNISRYHIKINWCV
jgi:hypothetical protein